MNMALARLIAGQIFLHACMTGMRMATPLLALREGYSAAAVGVLLALFALTQVFLALPAGRYADRHGLKRPVGYSVAVACVGAGLAVVVDEALRDCDLTGLAAWIEAQPSWSDFPFIVLTQRGGSVERNPGARRLSATLGNVSFLERPFHPTTLLSLARSALRGRKRQYEARTRLVELKDSEERFRTLFARYQAGTLPAPRPDGTTP